jgi:4-alpha-glucanotransferase
MISAPVFCFTSSTVVPGATLRAILSAMGLPAGDDAAVAASLALLDRRAWVRPLDSTTVVDEASEPAVTLHVIEGTQGTWTLTGEDGSVRTGAFGAAALPVEARRSIDGVVRVRCRLALPVTVPRGYHRLRIETATETADGLLIVAPGRCVQPQDLAPGRRLWGVAAQLYGLRSDRNWGMGDFTDLADLAVRVAGEGGALLGLNPLHALFPAEPGHISPYSPSTRAFLNTAYVDVAAIQGFDEDPATRALVASTACRALHAPFASSRSVAASPIASRTARTRATSTASVAAATFTLKHIKPAARAAIACAKHPLVSAAPIVALLSVLPAVSTRAVPRRAIRSISRVKRSVGAK